MSGMRNALVWFLMILVVSGLTSCGGSGGRSSSATGNVRVSMAWQTRAPIPSEVAKVVISIEAVDMGPVTQTVTKDQIVNGQINLSLVVPAGENRMAKGIAFDANNIELGRGVSNPFNVLVGQTTEVTLTIARVSSPCGYNSAVETLSNLSLSSVLPTIETQLKNANHLYVMRDAAKVRWTFRETGDDGYIYGSTGGRIVIASRRPMETLADVEALERQLRYTVYEIVARATTVSDAAKADIYTWIKAFYAQQRNKVQRAYVPGLRGYSYADFDGTARIPNGGNLSVKLCADQRYQNVPGYLWDGTQVSFTGEYGAYRRLTAYISTTPGDHGLRENKNTCCSDENHQAFLDVLYSDPPQGDEKVLIFNVASGQGETRPCFHISELYL